MKSKLQSILLLAFLAIFANSLSVQAQKTPDYKITNIKLVPFDGQTGKFQAEIKPNDERSFFNEIALSLFVVVEITGASGTFEAGRMADITILESKKQRAKKTEQIGLVGDGGKFYIPIWIDSALCSDVTVTARIRGQASASTMTRKASFQCGE